MAVGALLNSALIGAMTQDPDLHGRWVALSYRLASVYGGRAPLLYQADCRIDLLIRALEAEAAARVNGKAAPEGGDDFGADLQITLSRYWVLSTYEVLRIARNTVAGRADDRLKTLHHRFELVRIPIAKLEIPKDRLLGEGVAWLGRQGDGPDDPAIPYRKGDGDFSPLKVVDTSTGSVGWHTVDLKSGQSGIIYRRELSDGLLALFEAA